jgi:hypothetical protein
MNKLITRLGTTTSTLFVLFVIVSVGLVATVPGQQAYADNNDARTSAAEKPTKIKKDEDVFSGPQVGEALVPFKVKGVYGDKAGKPLDFVADANGKPVMFIFVHKLTRPGAALMRSLSSWSVAKPNVAGRVFIVWLTADLSQAQQFLTRASKSLNLKVPVGISPDGIEGPGAYGLNRNVELTIITAHKNKVTANKALVQPSVTESAAIIAPLADLIKVKPPTQEAMSKLAYPGGNMRKKRDKARGANNANGAQPPMDPQLGGLLREVIQKDADADTVAKAAAAVEKFVGDKKTHLQHLVRIAGVIIERKYGTEAAQKHARSWLKKYGGDKK